MVLFQVFLEISRLSNGCRDFGVDMVLHPLFQVFLTIPVLTTRVRLDNFATLLLMFPMFQVFLNI